MGLRDRDYMQDDGGEERGRRFEEQAQEAEYGSSRAKRQAHLRKLAIFFLVLICVLVAIAVLTSK